MTKPDDDTAGTTVEFHAGHRGDETPWAIVRGGRRLEISRILSREVVEDVATRARRRVWHGLLEDGRRVTVELLDDGAWRVSGLD